METKNHKYFICQYSFEAYRHGGVGYADIERILEKEGYQPIRFPGQGRSVPGVGLRRAFYLFRLLLKMEKRAMVVFIFPVYSRLVKMLLRLLQKRKQVNLVCVVGDIDGIKDGDLSLLETEIRELSAYRYFIVHNRSMEAWLRQQLPDCITARLDFFDFLAPPYTGNRSRSYELVFAGNLHKSSFIARLHELAAASPALHFNLYGPGITDAAVAQSNASFLGVHDPYTLPLLVKGSFGLLWDGDDIHRPGGSLGAYMQYITHHKLSLYILAGLPVIVPARTAAALLVEAYGIGLTVESLFEVKEKIDAVTDEQYQAMRKNMQPLAASISQGSHARHALHQLAASL